MTEENYSLESDDDNVSMEETEAEPEWDDSNIVTQAFNIKRQLVKLNVEKAEVSTAEDFDISLMEAQDLAMIKDNLSTGFWDYLQGIVPIHYKWGKKLTNDEIMSHTLDIEEPISRIPKSMAGSAVKIFRDVLDYAEGQEPSMGQGPKPLKDDHLKSFLDAVSMQHAKFRDEAFLQLIKQLRNNNGDESVKSVWNMFAALASSCSPSKEFLNPMMWWLVNNIENANSSIDKHMSKYVLAKIYYGYKLRVRRSFPITADEIRTCKEMKKTRVVVHLPNGAYMQCWVDSWETFGDLKKACLARLGIDEAHLEIFGFMECVEKRNCYEERYLDDFFSCTELQGFWAQYKKSRSDLREFKLYLTLRANKICQEDASLSAIQWMIMQNDFKRGKLNPTNPDIITCVSLSMQADLGDCPEKPNMLKKTVMNYIPINRESEGEEMWFREVIEAYKQLAGKGRDECMAAWFEKAADYAAFGSTQFTGRYLRCSDDDNHNQDIPQEEDCIFLIKHTIFQVLDSSTKSIQIDMDLNEISNWGCSKDIFVYSIGEAHSRVKEYFKCPAAPQLCWLLNVYANQYAGNEPDFRSLLLQHHIHLEKKKRNVSTFSKVSDV